MHNENPNGSFFDVRTLIAIVSVGVIWILWQGYMKSKYPQAFQRPAVTAPVENQETSSDGASTEIKEPPQQVLNRAKSDGLSDSVTKPEELFHYSDSVWEFDISSRGMGVTNVILKKYQDREDKPLKLAAIESGPLPFETELIGDHSVIDFSIQKVSDSEYVGVAKVGPLDIKKSIRINSANYTLDTTVTVNGAETQFSGLKVYVADMIQEYEKASFFLPSYEHQEFYVFHDGSNTRTIIPSDKSENIDESYENVNVASIGSQYFALALLDQSEIMPTVQLNLDQKLNKAVGTLSYRPVNRASQFKIQYTAFAGPKSLELLTSINENMTGIINFGWFHFIASQILKLMNLFYNLVGNYGVAIILLTLLVRFVLLPFNIMSYRSMKGMQKIQPAMKAIREKYKNDPARVNQEMIALMREHKVNPMGGCLPTLLQLPIFWALYQVLGQSIELYKAPFMLWIKDLSTKDPFYVLPILMGITMFVQMKTTPSTMDPAQQKVMMILPIVFSFFMITLPSGLTLYIFISALFSVAQQIYFTRDNVTKAA